MIRRLTAHSLRAVLRTAIIVLLSAAILSGCERPEPEVTRKRPSTTLIQLELSTPIPPTPTLKPTVAATATIEPLISSSGVYPGTPTPNPTRIDSSISQDQFALHYVTAGETLGTVAEQYEITLVELAEINSLHIDDFLIIGQELLVPSWADAVSPSFKIVPDSELVYGEAAKEFDVTEVAAFFGGYLRNHREEVEGQAMAGPEILQLVADRFSISPRLLFALLEHQSGWVTRSQPENLSFPMGFVENGYQGLYYQLAWAANLVNYGYYGRSEGGLRLFEVGGKVTVEFAPDINDATAGVQLFLGSIPSISYEEWLRQTGADGFFSTYSQLFGNPFLYTIDPLWPVSPTQPELSLPWEPGKTWYFTSGPHGGWASGSAWAALDFAPQDEQLGCYDSDAWVTAMSDGEVVRSGNGAVVVDLDGDHFAGTGWSITYMHLASRDRIPGGITVKEGDRLGHPSCEGGFSNGSHVHVARTYNGRWVSADGSIPFVLDGWVSQGLGWEYDGLLVKGDVVKEACNCREEENAIIAE